MPPFTRGKSAFTLAWSSPGFFLVFPLGESRCDEKVVFELFSWVFPRGNAGFSPGENRYVPGGNPGGNQVERKSKVGACLFRIADAGFPLGETQGEVGIPAFPQGFSGLSPGESQFSRSQELFLLAGRDSGGLAAPGFPQGKHRVFTRGKSVWMSPWFSPGEKRRRLVFPRADAMLSSR